MLKRRFQRALPGHLIELLEQRRLLSANAVLATTAAQTQLLPTTGSIRGVVVTDAGHDFVAHDYNDYALGKVKIFIDANRNGKLDGPQVGENGSVPGELNVVTDGTGGFGFANLAPGTYRVRQVPREGLTLFSAAYVEVVVTAGQQADAGTFQNTDYAVIDGTKHSDQIAVGFDPAGLRVIINGRAPRIIRGAIGILVQGGSGDDRIAIDGRIVLPTHLDGGGGADSLSGGGAFNRILGGRGVDSIKGGAAADEIDGGNDDDVIYGGAGNDDISGGYGTNMVKGADGILKASSGNDAIYGDAGNDSIYGGVGHDTISGGDGNDVITDNNQGLDIIKGGAGDDTFDVHEAVILLDGGAGLDSVTYFEDERLPTNIRRVEIFNKLKLPDVGGGIGGGFCFLTTAVVSWAGKADDCKELTLLRRFRDTYMRGLPEGADMIRDYYAHAPRIVRSIERNALAALEWPCVLAMVHAAIGHILAGRNAAALRVYSVEYLRLKARYVA